MSKSYKKLVRDNIPDIIKTKGEEPLIRILEDIEYKDMLINKLLEEIKEYLEEEDIEELADVFEVLYSLCLLYDSSFDKLLCKDSYISDNKINLNKQLLIEANNFLKNKEFSQLKIVISIINKIIFINKYNLNEIIEYMNEKRKIRGGFSKKIYLIGVK
ncbi:MAG: hypothetical protein PHQ89_00920 [Bacilli bacterium]|nr:hypothetical protein [Bacilli bacterium]